MKKVLRISKGKVEGSVEMESDELIGLFEQFDARQVFHVTFGSVLDDYGARLKDVLKANLALYDKYLKVHFDRHLEPFIENRD